MATIPGRQSNHSAVGIGDGHSIWNEFCHHIRLYHPHTESVVMFDPHNVIDTLCDFDESCDLAGDVDHFDPVLPLLCSYGFEHRAETFRTDVAWAPVRALCEGYIFIDDRKGGSPTIDIYRDEWMKNNTAIGYNTIGVRGYKGQVASLFGKPVLLFDDIEKNIELLRHRSSCQCPLDGVVVRRGKRADDFVRRGFFSSSDPTEWCDLIRFFNLTHRVPILRNGVLS